MTPAFFMMPDSSSFKLKVANSAIHGMGLFADEAIPAHSLIGTLQGKETQQDGMYVLWLDEHSGFQVDGDLKYINHSNAPNACYYDDLSVMTLCDIAAGEEITHNYEADW